MLVALVIAIVAALAASASPSTSPAPSTSSTPTLAGLAKLHHHAMGAMPASTARWSGSITRNGVTQPFTVTADSTGRYQGSWQTALGTTLVGSDGSVDWTQDEAGAVDSQPTVHGFSLGYELARLDAYDFANWSSAVTGPSTIDGHRCYAVKVADPR